MFDGVKFKKLGTTPRIQKVWYTVSLKLNIGLSSRIR